MTPHQELESLLAKSKGEREIHGFLKRYPRAIAELTKCVGLGQYTISEFNMGDEFRADFVTFAAFSGGWDINFVELEPVDEPLFRQDGAVANRLNGALKQIDEWTRFTEKNRPYLVQQLSRAARTGDLLRPADRDYDPECNAGWKMTDPRSSLIFRYYIVMGRSSTLTEKHTEIKASFEKTHPVRLATYDRLLQLGELI
jgi:hypothetical protein